MYRTIPILCVCAAFCWALSTEKPEPVAVSRLLVQGSNLTEGQVHELEVRLIKNESDLAARVPLLAYYTERSFSDPQAKADRRRHMLWLIRHQPALDIMATHWTLIDARLDPDLFTKARGIWQLHLENESSNPVILSHAACFLASTDFPAAEKLLDKAGLLDPTNPLWPQHKAQIHIRRMNDSFGEPHKQAAAAALTELQKAHDLTMPEDNRRFLLAQLGALTLDSGRLLAARQIGDRMVELAVSGPSDAYAGVLWHRGNILLGRVVLASGAPETAKLHLLEAAKLRRPSSQLSTFGPDMSLARDFLQKGDARIVADYLNAVSLWWTMDEGRLKRWKSMLYAGQTPDFGSLAQP